MYLKRLYGAFTNLIAFPIISIIMMLGRGVFVSGRDTGLSISY
jgi:hypothetical protein